MSFSYDLREKLSEKHLLKHPFYQAWIAGELKYEHLQEYAKQYYPHVEAFPRYISATHSNCENIHARQLLLENLQDEEQGERNHPELWLRFAEGLGVAREAVKNSESNPELKDLVDTFLRLSRSSYPEGLAALFAYEHQIPEIAETKIKGLKEFYNIDSPEALAFFEVHQKADVYHTQAVCELLDNLSELEQKKAEAAAKEISQKLWNFLSSLEPVRNVAC